MAHGGGGELMQRLIRERLLPAVRNEALAALTDGAVLAWEDGRVVFTTDSYVVTPIVFPGGDIGRLAVAGTVNDLAVMGASPVALSMGLILEEGLPLATLDAVMASAAATAREAGVLVVTGDTKVIERRGERPGMFINTAGVGRMIPGARVGMERIEPGDAVLVNGRIAEHGLAVMSVREGVGFESALMSDAAPLNGLSVALLASGCDVKFMRDATRGGLAGVLADICEARDMNVEVEEERIPISPAARHAAEMLGLDPLTVANEGKVVCVVAARDAERAVKVMRGHALGRHAAVIGRVMEGEGRRNGIRGLVELVTRAGGRRIVQRPYGEELPRIC
jgi:hydrogenase expression/formation protein HypE